ncbi:HSP20-like chaperone [Dactylonectria estremocensis]|uniref:HSP20-like chaperone n=1 Tax=Dactylonectria estremocensis TaxID=1079267 RepID=A0A9P9JHS5_9HYPO|nr:HSP20-like chaperone [Dactylonectria estremocensis]
MAFFPCKINGSNASNASNASYTPLFRLLDDFSNHYSPKSARRVSIPQWQPNFDIRETEQAYELHGEFPGVKKENVHIQFTEPQMIRVHGKTSRSYTSTTPLATPVEEPKASDSVTNNSEKRKSYQSTVEDEFEHVSGDDADAAGDPEEVEPKESDIVAPVPTKPAEKAKYWITERSVGQFSRSFHFPTRVDQDAVTANFDNGILTIVVPKAKKHEPQSIAIN